MYTPKHFEVTDRALLTDLMRRFSFATLVTTHEGRPLASHLPFLVYPDAGDRGSLVAHMARANEQWRDFASGAEALVIFQGDHAYITPSWYMAHPSVPTWNYMVVHAYGVPQVIADTARVREILGELVGTHEAAFAAPWPMDLPDQYMRKMMRGIVAFEIPIDRLEGKFKLSQNRPAVDQQRVIDELDAAGDPVEQRVAAMMRVVSDRSS
jgi:transcriptional regulator